jgi:histone H3/H4
MSTAPESDPELAVERSRSKSLRKNPVAEAIANIVAPSLLRYSIEAQQEHATRTADYFVSLESLSRVIARQKQSDDVQASHVGLAAEALGKNTSPKTIRRTAEIGFLMAGAGLGYLGNVILSEAYTFGNAMIFGVPILVGVGMYSYALGRE